MFALTYVCIAIIVHKYMFTIISDFDADRFTTMYECGFLENLDLYPTNKDTYPVVQAVACSIRSRLRRSHSALLSALYNRLAKIPALSCRLWPGPCNHAFVALMSGCAPYNRAFSVLIVCSLSMQ